MEHLPLTKICRNLTGHKRKIYMLSTRILLWLGAINILLMNTKESDLTEQIRKIPDQGPWNGFWLHFLKNLSSSALYKLLMCLNSISLPYHVPVCPLYGMQFILQIPKAAHLIIVLQQLNLGLCSFLLLMVTSFALLSIWLLNLQSSLCRD